MVAPLWFTLVAALACGCIPFPSSPPLAQTVGKGRTGFHSYTEVPVGGDYYETPGTARPPNGTTAPVPSLQLAYGLTDKVDIEGGFQFPMGISAAVRAQPIEGRSRLAVAGRVGYVNGTIWATNSSSSITNDHAASVLFAQAEVVGQYELTDQLRTGLALSVAPSSVYTDFTGLDSQDPGDFTAITVGASASITLVFGRFEFGPTLNVAHVEGYDIKGDYLQSAGTIVNLGLYIGVRPHPKRAAGPTARSGE